MSARTWTAVLALPGEASKVVELRGADLVDAIREVVGGWFDTIRLARDLVAFVHDEGICSGLPWNRRLGPTTWTAGPIVALGVHPHSGEERSVTATEIADLTRLFDVVAERMKPEPSSIAELEQLLGHRAVRFFVDGKEVDSL